MVVFLSIYPKRSFLLYSTQHFPQETALAAFVPLLWQADTHQWHCREQVIPSWKHVGSLHCLFAWWSSILYLTLTKEFFSLCIKLIKHGMYFGIMLHSHITGGVIGNAIEGNFNVWSSTDAPPHTIVISHAFHGLSQVIDFALLQSVIITSRLHNNGIGAIGVNKKGKFQPRKLMDTLHCINIIAVSDEACINVR